MAVQIVGAARTPSDPNHVCESSTLGYAEPPEIMASWDSFVAWAWPIDSCETLLYDGINYVHEVTKGAETRVVGWLNPRWGQNTQQMYLIVSYLHIIKRAKLDHLLNGGTGFPNQRAIQFEK